MEPIAILLLVAYASLLLELTVFPIPSEASTYQLLFKADTDTGTRDALASARMRSVAAKVLRYFLPTALGVVMFLIPLAAVFAPGLIDLLAPIAALRQPAIPWLGIAVVALGRGLTFASVLQLRAVKRRPGPSLQPQGLFTISRNPGLVGMYLFYVGNCMIFPCIVLFAGLPIYLLNMHRRALMEESHLAGVLGSTYRDYLRRVPRYLLF